ncbi:hypothetical protein LCGC14_2205230, partial [marine sediment metagenome]
QTVLVDAAGKAEAELERLLRDAPRDSEIQGFMAEHVEIGL